MLPFLVFHQLSAKATLCRIEAGSLARKKEKHRAGDDQTVGFMPWEFVEPLLALSEIWLARHIFQATPLPCNRSRRLGARVLRALTRLFRKFTTRGSYDKYDQGVNTYHGRPLIGCYNTGVMLDR